VSAISRETGIGLVLSEGLRGRPLTIDRSFVGLERALTALLDESGAVGYRWVFYADRAVAGGGTWATVRSSTAAFGGQVVSVGAPDQPADVAPGEVLVKFASGLSAAAIATEVARLGVDVVRALPQVGLYRLKLPAGLSVDEFLQAQRGNPAFQRVEANPIARSQGQSSPQEPNDPYWAQQWALVRIGAPAAWAVTTGRPEVVIAVIDTGVDLRHPDLQTQLVTGQNVFAPTTPPQDDHGHGTAMAGIIGAAMNNGVGIAGVCPGCRMMPIKVLDASGVGTYADVIEGMIYAAEHGARVLNLSLGGSVYSEGLLDVVDYVRAAGAVVVAAAGNSGTATPMYPAAYPGVLGASAVDRDGNPWAYSNSGMQVSLAAPGVDITATGLDGSYVSVTGTSPATAHVTGVAALIASRDPNMSGGRIEVAIMNAAEDLGPPGQDPLFGFGLVQAMGGVLAGLPSTPDLAVVGLQFTPSQFAVGQQIHAVITLQNRGGAAAASSQLHVSVDGTPIGTQVSPLLGPGQKIDVAFPWTVTANPTSVLTVMAAVDQVLDEVELRNNTATTTYQQVTSPQTGLISLYANNPPVHGWIAYQASLKLPAGSLKQELSGYVQVSASDPLMSPNFQIPSNWGTSNDAPGSAATAIIEGAWEEDWGIRPRDHFWNPDGGYNDGILGFDSALTTAVDRFSKAINTYGTSKSEAYYWLGRAAHLLADISGPAHAHNDQHAEIGVELDIPDNTEWYTAHKFPSDADPIYKQTTSGSSSTSIPVLKPIKSSYFTPTSYKAELVNLFLDLAELADNLDSDDVDGEVDNGTYNHFNTRAPSLSWTLKNVNFVKWHKQTTNGNINTGIQQPLTEASDYEYDRGTAADTNGFFDITKPSVYLYQAIANAFDEWSLFETTYDVLEVSYYDEGGNLRSETFDTLDDNIVNGDYSIVPSSVIARRKTLNWAIGYTAALYQYFWDQTHPTTTCTSFSINPTSANPSATANSTSVAIIGAPSGCTGGNWTTSGNGSWLTASPSSGSGSGSATVSWTQNTSTSPRSSSATIASNSFNVTQSGTATPTCTSFSINPTAASPSSAAGGVGVTLAGFPAGCTGGSWTASGNGSWITVSQTSGSGPGAVTVSWTQNTSTSSRSGNATIANNSFTVSQSGTGTTTVELVTNGTFASTTLGWTSTPYFYFNSVYDPNNTRCRSCPGYAYLAYNGLAGDHLTGHLVQTVTIPSNATSAPLTFWTRIDTAEVDQVEYDKLWLYIENTSGVRLGTAAYLTNLNKSTGWVQRTFNLLSLVSPGQTVVLRFYAQTDGTVTGGTGANPTLFRIDDVSILATTVTLPPTCTSFSINPTAASPNYVSSSIGVTVTGSPAGCTGGSWSTSESASWLTISPTSGTGSGSATVSWTQNSSTSSRATTATIANQNFTVNQGGAPVPTCTSFSISPTSANPSSSSGETGVMLTGSPAGCAGGSWNTAGNGSWITVSPGSGSGSGSATVSWAQNTSTSSRSSSATIANNSFTVNQSGAAAQTCTSFSINPTSASPSSSAGGTGVALTGSPAGCTGGSWAASGNGSWITVSPTSGSGPDVVTASWAQNSSTSSRSGNATIGSNSFTVSQSGAASPGAFNKTSPADGATSLSTNLALSWGPSSGVSSYEYCVDTVNNSACDASWVSVGTSTNAVPGGLIAGQTYYWHVRASNGGTSTYSDGSATAFWSFTTQSGPPGAFNKSSPANGATGQSTSPTLSWGTSSGVTDYQYCYDTTNDNACSGWTSRGTNTSVSLAGLSAGQTYYWHVLASNGGTPTYSDGSATAFWSFTTGSGSGGSVFTNPAQIKIPAGAPTQTVGVASPYPSAITVSNLTGTVESVVVSLHGFSHTFPGDVSMALVGPGGQAFAFMDHAGFQTAVANLELTFSDAASGVPPNVLASGVFRPASFFGESVFPGPGPGSAYLVPEPVGSATFASAFAGSSPNGTWQLFVLDDAASDYGEVLNGWSLSITTQSGLPGAFAKSSPANGASSLSTNLALSWGSSTGVSSYEYCIDATNDNACSGWANTGANTSVVPGGLAAGQTYYWQVRANNGGGTTYANGSATAFWSFTTEAAPPGTFSKISPTNGATNQSTSPTLSWGTSTGTVNYEYCYDTTNDNACSGWVSRGTNTSVALSGLTGGTWYYWHVRATNSGGTTYANGGATVFWSFMPTAPPGAFNKSSPLNGATNQSTSSVLSWGPSSGATSYEYCIDTSNNNVCNATWISTGASTLVGLSGLAANTPYFWQVRAINSAGTRYAEEDPEAYWSFTTAAPPPGAFAHLSPANGAAGQSLSPTLSWSASANATSYEYCIDTSNNFACDVSWVSVGNVTSAALSGLAPGTSYYWYVRAINAGGTTYAGANGSAYWSFTTVALPGAFVHLNPANGITGQSSSPTLSWSASAGATNYEYCIDTSHNSACNAGWVPVGNVTSVGLNGLVAGTQYSWHVRATNAGGTAYAEANPATFWSFTTLAPPGAFGHVSPANGATGQSTSPTLTWSGSSGATSYEYCIDTTNNNACSSWISTGASTFIALSALDPDTSYFWQVRASNAAGTRYAETDPEAFWSFRTTVGVPGPFSHTSPANGSTGQSISPTLNWGASTGVASYEYCIDTSNNNACNSGWVSTGAATSVNLSGLAYSTVYFWQVRAVNAAGTRYAESDPEAFWSFTTVVQVPGDFVQLTPIDGAVSQSLTPALFWGVSSGAASYEYCIDTINNSACDSGWVSTGGSPNALLGGLFVDTTYYWHVRARNAGGITYAGGSSTTFRSFTTVGIPGAFWHVSPANGATGQSTSPTLSWSASSGAASYEYCIDLSNNNVCNASWVATGSAASVALSGLVANTPYFWQVRAINGAGTRYAESDPEAYWTFTPSAETFTITLASTPIAGGTTTGAGTFAGGTMRTVTATPNSGYGFRSWTEGSDVVSLSTSYSFALTRHRNLVANFEPPDSYEPDDLPAQASTLLRGTPQVHVFHRDGDVDWARFSVTSGQAFRLATTNLASVDTVLSLFGADATTLLASNDDGGGGRDSQIVFVPTVTGTYYVRVVQFGDTGVGGYRLSLADSPAPPTDEYAAPLTGGGASSALVDLNGDGKGDVFTYKRTTGQWVRAVTQPGGGFAETSGVWAPGWSLLPATFDGDALTDLFLFNNATGQWAKMLNDGTGFTEQATGTWWAGWQKFVLDLDGDGISDLFIYDPSTGTWFKCVSTSSGFTYNQGGWSPDWEVTVMTLNGDAFGDLFLINRATGRWFWVLGAAGGGFTYPVSEVWFPSWNFYPGDFNGDGLSDLLLHDPPTGTYFVAMNTGSGFSYTQGGWSLGWSPYVGDLNGDGADDLFLHDPSTGVWFQMISNQAGGFTNAAGEIWSLGWRLQSTDFNGDGRADLLLYHPTTGVWYQARNLTLGSFNFSSGTWSASLTVVVRTPPFWIK